MKYGIMLPVTPSKGGTPEPKKLLIYSAPKVGKTSLVSRLPDNLIIDFERGSHYVDALRADIISLKKPKEDEKAKELRHARSEFALVEVIEELEKMKLSGNFPYKYITLDTATKFEEMCEFNATVSYMKTPQGKNFNRVEETAANIKAHNAGKGPQPGSLKPAEEWEMVTNLDYGKGYGLLREEFKFWLSKFYQFDCTLILLGHVKDKIIDTTATTVSAKDIDLTGKLKLIASALFADAIGYMYRDGVTTKLSFVTSESLVCGSRCDYLAGKEFVIARKENDQLNVDWTAVFPSLSK